MPASYAAHEWTGKHARAWLKRLLEILRAALSR
jgi:hypothetical protein